MRFAGIDIGSERHLVAMVDDVGRVLAKPSVFGEELAGYERLTRVLGQTDGLLVVMEATGHYWFNLYFWLSEQGYRVAVINPLKTACYAKAELRRAKTDAIDALGLARYGQEKRPATLDKPDKATVEARELARFRERLVQDQGDRVRLLHRHIDLAFPEFTRVIKDISSQRSLAILTQWPTAAALREASFEEVAELRYDGRHRVGDELASQLIAHATASVGQHSGAATACIIRVLCQQLRTLAEQVSLITEQVRAAVDASELGKLLISIPGIAHVTAARLLGEVGNPARFRDGNALASYVGVVPSVSHSGKHAPRRGELAPYGNRNLRRALWMPTLIAIQKSPWLQAFYDRLVDGGKPPKLAIIAAMRKLLTAVWSVANRGTPFKDRIDTKPSAPEAANPPIVVPA